MDPEQRRGGKGGGKDPPMKECRQWMKKIQVPGKDYKALVDSAVGDAGDDAAEDQESKEEQGDNDEMVEDLFLPGNVGKIDETMQSHNGAVSHQISVSPLDGANSLELAMPNDRQFTFQDVDVPFSESNFPSAFESPFETYYDGNAAGATTPSINIAHSQPTLSSSAPAAVSFLSSNPADTAQAHDNFDSTSHSSLIMPSITSMTSTAHTLEDLNNFEPSYILGNFSYRMSSPNNPQVPPYGLLDFPESPPFP